MSEAGTVTAIHLAAEHGAPATAVERVRAIAGEGLQGDRHCIPGQRDDRQLTLVESEELAALAAEGFDLEPGESRRQLTTAGVRLAPLVGRRFRVGPVECLGVEPCDPCRHLERLTGRDGILKAMAHRGGLCAEILGDGEIAVGDAVVVLD